MNTLRIFIAGASGTLGRRLVPQLVARGHHVTGTTRSRADALRALGAEPVVVDPLDADAIREAVLQARPDVVVHQLTALAGVGMTRNWDKAFALTNRLRTEGTDHLIAAARAAGARRLVWQSYAGWPYARVGSKVKTEGGPPRPRPPRRRARDAGGDPPSRGGGDGLRPGGRRAPVRRLLRAGHVARRRRRAPRPHPQAPVPARRRRHRRVVVRAHRRRRGG